MRREGRQHGMVRCYQILPSPFNPRPETRCINRLDSPPTAGLFTKVSPRPTNHSKFTGKCGKPRCPGCHIHPATKAKAKAKGTQKLIRSGDVLSNLVWRVAAADAKPVGLKFSRGVSASGMMDHLHNDSYTHDDDEEEEECELAVVCDSAAAVEFVMSSVETSSKDDINDDEDGDRMSFSDVAVAVVWEQHDEDEDEDEDWCLVGETLVL